MLRDTSPGWRELYDLQPMSGEHELAEQELGGERGYSYSAKGSVMRQELPVDPEWQSQAGKKWAA